MSKRLVLIALLATTVLAGCTAAGAEQDAPTTSHLAQYLPGASTGTAGANATAAHTTAAHTTAAPRTKDTLPPPNLCLHNTAAQLILVSITRQHAWLCAKSRTAYSTAVTTGMNTADTRTPTGRFRIQGRDRDSVLTQSNGDTYDVKYWIPFEAPTYGFHDASWQHFPYGSPKYRTNGSHGCVHMPLPAMRFLYNWVKIGASVDIRA
ncbi:MAG: L,D-transpeptidase [Jatrophihabitantaceae bacterium]